MPMIQVPCKVKYLFTICFFITLCSHLSPAWGIIGLEDAVTPKELLLNQPKKNTPPVQSTNPQKQRNTSQEQGLSLENYLKSKYYGRAIHYFDHEHNRYRRGQVISHIKKKDQIHFIVYNDTGQKTLVNLKFKKHHWGHINRRGLVKKKRSNRTGDLANVENEKQFNVLVQSMLSDGSKNTAADTSFLSSQKQDSIKRGPSHPITYYHDQLKKNITASVFVKGRHIYLDDRIKYPMIIEFEAVY